MKIQHACVGMTRKLRFESNVILYGNKTKINTQELQLMFESSVILYGNKTNTLGISKGRVFESSVISYHKYS